ncbi:peptide ABC transporter substrate-binding protein [Paracoccus aurantiacus]|uniref:Peptide ABC transporter substrate-binding protein n=1 Tax=Paracoccus aurantiacus TaxID=2599412 RepID=A0A5C6SAT1_9RHOB|nr:peptide ABC transporter substrate-binding protein [Paracoccus aurantiacus]TXB70715.1 peptide ABC transporter substrate-binding protein [Paracoccus aurantiacus]
MTRFLMTTALALSFAAPVAAATVAEGDVLDDTQEYRFWMLDALKSADPHKNTSKDGSQIVRQLFEGLMTEDGNGAMQPGVASEYTVSDDKTVYTFTLRPDAKWSNGDPVTANDFVYSWRRLADPATASEYAWFIELMNVANATEVVKGEQPPEALGVKAIDDHTFEVTLKSPTPHFEKTLAFPSTYPVNQKVVEEFGTDWTTPENIVSNGAFVMQGHNVGVDITMVPNPEYWDRDSVILDKVTAVTVPDANIGLTRYQAGELDRVQPPSGQFPRLLKEFPDEAVARPYACTYAYLLNLTDTGNPAVQDQKIRRALALAVDRDVLVGQVLQAGQQPAYGWTNEAIEGFTMPELDMAKMTQADRLAEAKAIMEEAGYSASNPLKLDLMYNTSEEHRKIAIVVQQMWKQIGVDLVLNNLEWKVYSDRMNSQQYEVVRSGWCADYNEASTFLDYFRSTGYNVGKYNSEAFDAVMDASKTSDDPAVEYAEAERILAADVPYVPLYQYTKVDLIKPYVKGLPEHNVMDAWYAKDIYITEH